MEKKYNQTDGHTLVGSDEEQDPKEDRRVMICFKNKINGMELNAQIFTCVRKVLKISKHGMNLQKSYLKQKCHIALLIAF